MLEFESESEDSDNGQKSESVQKQLFSIEDGSEKLDHFDDSQQSMIPLTPRRLKHRQDEIVKILEEIIAYEGKIPLAVNGNKFWKDIAAKQVIKKIFYFQKNCPSYHCLRFQINFDFRRFRFLSKMAELGRL